MGVCLLASFEPPFAQHLPRALRSAGPSGPWSTPCSRSASSPVILVGTLLAPSMIFLNLHPDPVKWGPIHFFHECQQLAECQALGQVPGIKGE